MLLWTSTTGPDGEHRAARDDARLLLLLSGNLRSGFSRLAEGDRHGLLATFYLLPAARLQRALLVLLHDLVDLALPFAARAGCGMG